MVLKSRDAIQQKNTRLFTRLNHVHKILESRTHGPHGRNDIVLPTTVVLIELIDLGHHLARDLDPVPVRVALEVYRVDEPFGEDLCAGGVVKRLGAESDGRVLVVRDVAIRVLGREEEAEFVGGLDRGDLAVTTLFGVDGVVRAGGEESERGEDGEGEGGEFDHFIFICGVVFCLVVGGGKEQVRMWRNPPIFIGKDSPK